MNTNYFKFRSNLGTYIEGDSKKVHWRKKITIGKKSTIFALTS